MRNKAEEVFAAGDGGERWRKEVSQRGRRALCGFANLWERKCGLLLINNLGNVAQRKLLREVSIAYGSNGE